MTENMPGVSEEAISQFRSELSARSKQKGALILLLQSAQETFGYIPENVIYEISEMTEIPAADIYGVITFYAQFRLKPMGKHVIRICEGTACHVNGARGILQTLQDELSIGVGDTTEDGLFTLLSVACLGCCSLSPVIMIDGETYGSLTADRTRKIIKKYRSGHTN
jgi:NADH-quinone oxidoreductase subunit E